MASSGVVKRRRNGRLASCEQCRVRKIACDHKKPACGRCESRGIGKDCHYHAAPLTKSKMSSAPTLELTSLFLRDGNPDSTLGRASLSPNARSHVASLAKERSQPSVQPTGFVGASSSSAVVAEINDSLGIETSEPPYSHIQNSISDEDIQEGVEVISFLRNAELRHFMHEILNLWLSRGSGHLIYGPVYKIWLDELDRFLEYSWVGLSNLALSAQIWYNTQRSYPGSQASSATVWALQAAGANLRWEVVGLIFSLIGTEISDMPGWHAVFSRLPCGLENRTQSMRRLLQLGNTCIKFSKQCGPRNDLMACLMYMCMLMTERAVGDSSNEAWHNMGIVCDTVISMGLHQNKKVDANTPFYLRELRNRLFNLVYNHDKFLAEFLGRPPRISYRHCSIQELSDLSDEEICAGEVVLPASIAEDRGQPRRSMWRKAFYSMTKIREDILEMTLGQINDDFRARLAAVRSSLKRACGSMSSVVQVDVIQLLHDIRHTPQRIPGTDIFWKTADVNSLAFINLAKLRLEFLIERASINAQETTNTTSLIDASRRLLSLCLKILSCKDYFSEHHIDLIDVVYFEALPPAGVLAIELLKQDRRCDNNEFPRSDILQSLSILVPELGAVGPEEGNYGVCVQGANALKKVLETSLAKPSYYVNEPHPLLLDSQLEFNNDAAFLDWLGNIDFETVTL